VQQRERGSEGGNQEQASMHHEVCLARPGSSILRLPNAAVKPWGVSEAVDLECSAGTQVRPGP
jgi:hypothetical protein